MAELRIRDIPEDVYRKFKSLCALKGVTLNKTVIELLEWKIKKHEREEKK
ncbi:MAG: hypothetical protein KAJ15_08080 [Spirochaetes bacterium]|nr:hypothetical protein [Spirochaetota bacterium]